VPIEQPKAFEPKVKEVELRSVVNWQEALYQKGIK
jgi:hypothetical protein